MNDRGEGELVMTEADLPALKARLEAYGWQVPGWDGPFDCKAPGPKRKHTKPSRAGLKERLAELELSERAKSDPLG